MAEGSGAQPDSMTPSPLAIDQVANKVAPKIPSIPEVPFAEPFKDQPMVDLVKNTVEKIDSSGVIDSAKDAALDIYGA